MGLSLQNIRDGILKATATDLTDWANGDTDLDLYANQSWWDIMDQFDFREKEATPLVLQTVGGVNTIDIPSSVAPIIFDALQRVSIEDPVSFQHTDLDLITDFDYENNFINDSSDQAAPTNYFRRGSQIYLYPTPDTIYNISFYYLQVLTDLSIGTAPVIPQSWHEIIKYGAIWRALLDVQDYHKAAEIKRHQIDLINSRTPVKAKELSDTKLAGVQVPGRSYP